MASLNRRASQSTTACIICHKKKIKCDLISNKSDPCTNCRTAGYDCRPYERKRKRYTNSPPHQSVKIQSRNVESAGQVASFGPHLNETSERAQPQIQSSTHSIQPLSSFIEDTSSRAPQDESYRGRSEYLGGDVPFSEEMVKNIHQISVSELSDTDLALLRQQKAFDLPPRAVRSSLIDSFMTKCLPWTPIVESIWLDGNEGQPPSMLLLQSVFLAGSRVMAAPLSYATSAEFYRRAKLLFFFGAEKNAVLSIVSVCLLHWWNPVGPEQISTDTSGFWVRVGVGIAYQIGLHKEPAEGQNKKFRRRLWWSLVCRDNIISIGVGRPRAINLQDSDVRPPSVDDFPARNSHAKLFVAYVGICRLLGDITECRLRRKFSQARRTDFENALYRWIKELPTEFQLFRQSPDKSLSKYNFEARQLLLPYFVILIILHRPQSPDSMPSSASLVASSFVAGIYEDFLARDEFRYLGPVFAFYALAAGLSQLSACRYASLQQNALQELKIIEKSLQELSKRWGSSFGSLRALGRVHEAVSRQSLLDSSPEIVSAEVVPFFDSFGPQLCRRWYLLGESASASTNLSEPLVNGDITFDSAILSNLEATDQTEAPYRQGSSQIVTPDFSQLYETFLANEDQNLWSDWDVHGSWLLNDWGSEEQW